MIISIIDYHDNLWDWIKYTHLILIQSDSNSIQFSVTLRRQPISTKSASMWSHEEHVKRPCFEWTDWTVFQEEDNDMYRLSDKISCYIHFCVKTVIPCKTLKCCLNNKAWITSGVKSTLNRKKAALVSRDNDQIKATQSELRNVIRQDKRHCKLKVEGQLSSSDTTGLWKEHEINYWSWLLQCSSPQDTFINPSNEAIHFLLGLMIMTFQHSPWKCPYYTVRESPAWH